MQRPIYCKALMNAEKRYLASKKLVMALVTLIRKLKPYFQAHTITAITNLLFWQGFFVDPLS